MKQFLITVKAGNHTLKFYSQKRYEEWLDRCEYPLVKQLM